MCGRFTLYTKAEALEERFHAKVAAGAYSPTYNAAPSQALLTILNDDPHAIVNASWGFVPEWAKGRVGVKPVINAREESVASKPFFRAAFKNNRALILADGFYEWRKTKSGKVPYRIALKSAEPFAFAGIWSHGGDVDGKSARRFAIITTEPNELMAQIHNRMPVILREEDEEDWLNPQLPLEEAERLLVPYPAERLTAYEVSKRVNSVANNGQELVEAVR